MSSVTKKFKDTKKIDEVVDILKEIKLSSNKINVTKLKDSKKSSARPSANSSNKHTGGANLKTGLPLNKTNFVKPAVTNFKQATSAQNHKKRFVFKNKEPTFSNATTKPITKNTGAIHKTKQSNTSKIIFPVQNDRKTDASSHSLQVPLMSEPKEQLLSEMLPTLPLMKSKSMTASKIVSKGKDIGKASVVFTETVNATFTSTGWNEGFVRLLGKLTFNFQKNELPLIEKNFRQKTGFKFHLYNIQKLEEITVNEDWLKWLPDEKVKDCCVILVNTKKMLDLIHQKCSEEQSTRNGFFSIEALTYKIKSSEEMKSCPLLISSKWMLDGSKTRLKIKYKYNPQSMTDENPLKDVKISVQMKSGFNYFIIKPDTKQCLPTDQSIKNKITWNIGDINSENNESTISGEFKLDDEPTEFGIVSAEFKSPKNNLSGVRFRSENDLPIKDVVSRVFAGKYICKEVPLI